MDKLVLALGPAFVAGFALQRLLEILDPLVDGWVETNKKIISGLISLLVGLLLATFGGLRVLAPLNFTQSDIIDDIVTGLVISGGTEGFNSIMKFLGYSKEEKKSDAASKAAGAPTDRVAMLARQVG